MTAHFSKTAHPVAFFVRPEPSHFRGHFCRTESDAESIQKNYLTLVRGCTSANIEPLFSEETVAALQATVAALIAKPHGCIYCDYGTLRNPPKFPHSKNTEHDDDCGFAMAERLGFIAVQP